LDRTERFYRIEMLMRQRNGISFDDLLEDLEVSRATLKRDLQYLRDRMDAPITYDRGDNLYRFATDAQAGPSHELPGVWFSEPEIHALLTMHELIAGLDAGGVLGRHLAPLLDKLHGMLGASAEESRELMRRVKIMSPARRPVTSKWFEVLGSALLSRLRVELDYYSRARQSSGRRTVSPQRLIHYRNTWYLDAWCHDSDGLRRFAVDAMRSATLTDVKARDVPLRRVETELDGGYGIFSGSKVSWATLQFDAEAAQWVANEEWHPKQTVKTLPDGSLQMRLPYTDTTELVMDLLRHGEHVKVIAPDALATQVRDRLAAAGRQYEAAGG